MARLRFTSFEIDDATLEQVALIRTAMGGQAVEAPAPVAEGSAAAVAAEIGGQVERDLRRVLEPKEEAAVLRRPRQAKAAPAAAEPEGEKLPGGIAGQILPVLARAPRSSLELAALLKLEPKQVYMPLKMLKDKGLIVSRDDESDGTRRYFLAGK